MIFWIIRYEYEKAFVTNSLVLSHEIVRKVWMFHEKKIKILMK